MSGWENFFLGELGASAALAGLIFVGLSINLQKIMNSPHLPNRVLEALVVLVAVLFLASLLLIPNQSFLAIGIEVLLLGLCEWIVMVFLQIDSLRKMPAEFRLAFTRVILVCQLATLSFITAGIIFLLGGTTGFYWIVAAVLLSFLATFVDIWVLVVEINR
ncbi:MAG TPA: hypothetical protein VGU68_10645 [Ktedonobacteraceae bacterium]|nr:hypothetical protein [Ktedonobacteraceae bacterium]